MVLVNGHSALLLSCDMKFWAFALEILFNTFLGNGCANLNESNGRPPWNLKFEYTLTEYKYDYYSVWKNRQNTNIIQFEKIDWIRIRILFSLKKSTEYEYEYYSVWKNRLNLNTNIIWFEKIDRIRIRILVFLYPVPLHCTFYKCGRANFFDLTKSTAAIIDNSR